MGIRLNRYLIKEYIQMASKHCLFSVAKSCPVLCDPMNCSTPGFPVLHYLSEFTQTHVSIELVMPFNNLIFCHPLLLLSLVFPGIRLFSSESALPITWPKYWSFSFSISLSDEYSGLISFSTDWFDLLAVQRILKSLLQHHSSKVSILQCSAFFMVQLSHLYMTPGKTICVCMSEYIHHIFLHLWMDISVASISWQL